MSAKSPDPIDRLVGRNIHIQRMAKGISQVDLAEQLGVSFQQVQKYERGTNRIGAGRLVRIAGVLDVSILTLFEGTDGVHGPNGPSPQALLAHPQHFSLVQAFSRVEDKTVRRAVLELVRTVAQRAQARRRDGGGPSLTTATQPRQSSWSGPRQRGQSAAVAP
jgi:transcriptional regulator with XRE-family HTH domain